MFAHHVDLGGWKYLVRSEERPRLGIQIWKRAYTERVSGEKTTMRKIKPKKAGVYGGREKKIRSVCWTWKPGKMFSRRSEPWSYIKRGVSVRRKVLKKNKTVITMNGCTFGPEESISCRWLVQKPGCGGWESKWEVRKWRPFREGWLWMEAIRWWLKATQSVGRGWAEKNKHVYGLRGNFRKKGRVVDNIRDLK